MSGDLDFGLHEALDRSCLVMEMVDDQLVEHPTIQQNEQYRVLAQKALDALFELYQKIGEDEFTTIGKEPENA